MLEGILFGGFISPHFIAASRLGLETCPDVTLESDFRSVQSTPSGPQSPGTDAAFSEPRPLPLYHPVKEQVGVDFSRGRGSRH